MTLESQLNNEIRIINRTLHDYGVDAGTKPAWTTVAGSSFVAYGLRTGPAQPIDGIARRLPELTERITASRKQPTPVRLRYMPLALEVTHPNPQPLDWRAATLRIGAGRILVGRNYSITPVADCVLDLERMPHVLIVGMSGTGKSTMLRTALTSFAYSTAPDTAALALIDLKNEDLVPFAALPHVEMAAWDEEEAPDVIRNVHAELRRRVQAGTGDWRRIVLVIDELAELDTNSLALLGRVLAVGRSKSINVVAATQHPVARLIGEKSNYSVRLVGQIVDGPTAALASGRKNTGAELLPGNGAFLCIHGSTLDRIQAYFLPAEPVPALVSTIAAKWGPAPARTVTRPAATPVDEIAAIAGVIADMWRDGASKNAMAKAALDRPYAGSYAAKIDRAIALLEASTTPSTPISHTSENADGAGSSRTAPIIRLAARNA